MRVHIHTDSPFFSGAENMIATFLADEEFVRDYSLVVSYRASDAYEAGLAERAAGTRADLRAVELLDIPARTDPLPALRRQLAKASAYATFARQRYLAENRRRLAALFAETKPDIVHVNSGGYPGAYSTLAAVLAARDAGVGHVIYVANNIATPYSWRRSLERALDARIAAAVDVFVTGSSFAAQALRELLDLPAEKARAIPNGVRPREIVEAPGALRERIGAPRGRPFVLVVANLERRKGHAHLLGALAHLKATRFSPLPWLAIEGTGPEESALREAAFARDLSGDVAFLGHEARVFDLMNAADVLVLPSIANEDLPNVVLEAAYLGKPMVASRIAGTPEQIVDGETGLLVEPGDEPGLARAIASLAGSAELRERMGAAARRRFEECYTAERAVFAYRELYSEVASKPAQAGGKR